MCYGEADLCVGGCRTCFSAPSGEFCNNADKHTLKLTIVRTLTKNSEGKDTTVLTQKVTRLNEPTSASYQDTLNYGMDVQIETMFKLCDDCKAK